MRMPYLLPVFIQIDLLLEELATAVCWHMKEQELANGLISLPLKWIDQFATILLPEPTALQIKIRNDNVSMDV